MTDFLKSLSEHNVEIWKLGRYKYRMSPKEVENLLNTLDLNPNSDICNLLSSIGGYIHAKDLNSPEDNLWNFDIRHILDIIYHGNMDVKSVKNYFTSLFGKEVYPIGGIDANNALIMMDDNLNIYMVWESDVWLYGSSLNDFVDTIYGKQEAIKLNSPSGNTASI
jgi:hypothetical protein